MFKGAAALCLFKFPELKRGYWKGELWSPIYHAGTAGHASAETIQKHIEEQKTLFIQPSRKGGLLARSL